MQHLAHLQHWVLKLINGLKILWITTRVKARINWFESQAPAKMLCPATYSVNDNPVPESWSVDSFRVSEWNKKYQCGRRRVTLSASPPEYSCGAMGWVLDGWLRQSQWHGFESHFWHQMSQEPSLGFEPTSLRLPESAVQHLTHCATRGQTESDPAPTTYNSFTRKFVYWPCPRGPS